VSGAEWYVCGVIAMAAALGASGRADVDVVGALIWLALAFGRILPMPTLLAGFGSDAVLLVGSMMAVAEALRRVGAADAVTRWILGRSAGAERGARVALVAAGSVFSALLETTAATVGLLPTVARLGRGGGQRPQRLYLIAAIGTMAGGVLTVVGTSGNVVANGVLAALGQTPFAYLGPGRLGIFVVAFALLYAATVAGRLLPPARGVALDEAILALRSYVTEVRLAPDSPWVGQSLREAGLRARVGVDVLSISRGGGRQVDPGPDQVLRAGDVLLVAGPAEAVAGLAAADGAAAVAAEELQAATPTAEGLVPPGSAWVGATLASLRARGTGMRVLGIWRHGQTLTGRLADVRLRAGDVLLARGERSVLSIMQAAGHVAWLNPVSGADDRRGPAARRRLWTAVFVLVGFVAAAATGRLDLGLLGFAAAAAMIVTGCLDAAAGYSAVQWKVLVLLAGVIPLGQAMSHTGLAASMAHGLLFLGRHFGAEAALAGLCVATALVTQVLSNVATAAVMTPVAVHLAQGAGLTVHACVAGVLVAALCTPLTGMASKPTILVQEAGGYGTMDYLRLGLPFAVASLALAVLLAPRLWPA
jgi:di/tricarboxylate transporter